MLSFVKYFIQYDIGRQYPEAFKRKNTIQDSLGRPSPEIRAIQAKVEMDHRKQELQSNIAKLLKGIHRKLPNTKHLGREKDILYLIICAQAPHLRLASPMTKRDQQIFEAALELKYEDLRT
jgi:hypothetical protein